MQSIYLIETDAYHAYRTSKDLVSEKEEIKCNNIVKRYKTIYPQRIFVVGGSGSGKTNSLCLIIHQPDIDKTSIRKKVSIFN